MENVANIHFSISMISRGKGKSAVASAAYISREKITNEWDGITHDYSKKKDLIYSEIFLPKNIPKEFKNRNYLWNSVELNNKSINSQLARQFIIALPKELSVEENKNLITEYVKENFVSRGMIVDVAIHNEDKGNGNIHAHIMATTKMMNERGEWLQKSKKEKLFDKNENPILNKSGKQKTRKIDLTGWDDRKNCEKWRENFASICNKYLEENGLSKRVDHRSFKRQGSDLLPTIHMGASASALERKGIKTDKGNYNREVKKHNALVLNIKAQYENISHFITSYINNLKSIFGSRKYENNFTETSIDKTQSLNDEVKLFNISHYLDVFSMLQDEKVKNLNNYAKNKKIAYDLKKYASAISYIRNNKIKTISDLQEKIEDTQKQNRKLNKKAKEIGEKVEITEKLIACSDVLKVNSEIFSEYNSKTFFKDKFYKEHKKEIERYKNAKGFIEKILGVGAKIEPKKWQIEKEKMITELNSINKEKEGIQESYQKINHIKYAITKANEYLGVDITLEIDKLEKRGEKASTLEILERFKRQIEKDKRYNERAKEKYKSNRENER